MALGGCSAEEEEEARPRVDVADLPAVHPVEEDEPIETWRVGVWYRYGKQAANRASVPQYMYQHDNRLSSNQPSRRHKKGAGWRFFERLVT